jgi:hypothetical protein
MMPAAPPPRVLAAACAASPLVYGAAIGAASRSTGAVRTIAVLFTSGKPTAYVYRTIGSETYLVRLVHDDPAAYDAPSRIASPADAVSDPDLSRLDDCPSPTPAPRATP